ncbi:hypothetical protein E1H99_00395 [Enterococcus hirae]|nr:hypothetical protein E1H99_00395 [Enterococcus hirae]
MLDILYKDWFPFWRKNVLPKEEEKEEKKDHFEKRVDMLALTLSLKENDKFFETSIGYQLLFSTYIKMIESDQNDFFIEKKRKEKIIQSLERTKIFYQFGNKESLQSVFEKMSNNDPTDFMLFPSEVFLNNEGNFSHFCGLTVYKKNEKFLVMRVDKERCFDKNNVSYFKIPSTNVSALSRLFLLQRDFEDIEPHFIFKRLKELSSGVKTIPAITMQEQSMDNGVISEIEASLKTILFNCRTDIFGLAENKSVTPKWNLEHQESTLEMKKRFLSAMKGENKDWNQHFDYLFDYYLYRKGKLIKNSYLETQLSNAAKCLTVQEIFSMDAYIPEMLENNGQIPTTDVTLLQDEIKVSEPPGILHKKKIEKIISVDLEKAVEQNTEKIIMLNERLPLIKISRAKELAECIISCLKDKNLEIEAEIQRREAIEKGKQDQKGYNQTFDQVVSNVSQNRPTSLSQSLSSTQQSTLSFLIGKACSCLICKRSENISQKKEQLDKKTDSISGWQK